MLFTRTRQIRLFSAAAALIVAMLFAPSAFARGGHHGHHGGSHHNNWGISLGFSGPGYSIGYSDCRHCGSGYVSGNFYGGYGGYGGYGYNSYYPAYYDSYYYPGYSVGYYDYPSYRHRPVTRRIVRYNTYYDDGPRRHDGYHRGGRSHGRDSGDYGDRDRGYSSRAAYYDRRN